MKRQRIIWFRSVSLLLVGLLLFLAGWGRSSMGLKQTVGTPLPNAQTAPNAEVSDCDPSDRADAPTETQVSTAAFEAVVTPATSFDFGQTVWLLPPPVMAVLLLLAAVTTRILPTEPYFYFSFFRHVFGHFIAPNAP